MPCTNGYVPVRRVAVQHVVIEAGANAFVKIVERVTSSSRKGVTQGRSPPQTRSARKASTMTRRTFGRTLLRGLSPHVEEVVLGLSA